MTGATATAAAADSAGGIDELAPLWRAAAEDLRLIAVIHDREADTDLITRLKETGFPAGLGLKLASVRADESEALIREALDELASIPPDSVLDELAADYADIYLNHGIHASPCESVWTDEEGLICQQSMFQVREWYQKYGLSAANWRTRADDHLVIQLLFAAHLFDDARSEDRLAEIATFLDEHLLRWVNDFAQRVAGRCATAFYAGAALLTAAYVEELRELMATVIGQPRPSAEEIEKRMRPKNEVVVAPPAPYVPGTSPSW
ncbi:MAG: molecular chaperone TorD family protein [Pseudomonadota bacterium]